MIVKRMLQLEKRNGQFGLLPKRLKNRMDLGATEETKRESKLFDWFIKILIILYIYNILDLRRKSRKRNILTIRI